RTSRPPAAAVDAAGGSSGSAGRAEARQEQSDREEAGTVGMRTDLQRGPWPLGRGGGFFDDWRQILWRPWDLWRDDLWRNLDAHLGGQRPSVDVSDAG